MDFLCHHEFISGSYQLDTKASRWSDAETPGRGIKSRFDIVSTDFAASSG